MKATFKTGALLVGLVIVTTLLRGEVDRGTIRQAEVQQQQLRMQVADVTQQLEALIAEFEHNGLDDGDEVQTLKALHGAMASLSETEMQRVIALLQASRGAADPSQSRQYVADAYTSQKAIIAQLNQILIEYRRQEAMYDLSRRFAEAAERQNANLKETIALARETGGRSVDDLKDSVQLALQIQATEQESLHDEVSLLLDELKHIIDSATGDQRERMLAALRQSEQGRLMPSLRQAASDLAGASLFRAASNQQMARDQLRELARTLARPKDRIRQLQDATQELARLADEQQRVTDDARRLEQRWNESDAIDTELAQADVVDRSEQIRRDVAEIAPELAEAIRAAQDPMQETRAALNSKQSTHATQQSQNASRHLQQLVELAREELSRAQQSNTLPAEAEKAIATLLDRVRQLRDQQQILQRQTTTGEDGEFRSTLASRQSSLQRETRDVESMANARVPQAADPLRRAANQMQEAGMALLAEAFVVDQATTPQKAAIAALEDAESILIASLADIADKKERLVALEKVRQDVGEMMMEQRKLSTSTAREAAKEKPIPEELATQQDAVAKRAAEAAKQIAETATPAAEALSQAGEQMEQAGKQLADNQPQAAQPQQQEAMHHLQQAQQTLDQQIAQLQNDLGTPPNPQQNLQDAADALAEAQQNLTETIQQLPTAGDLLEQQQAIAEALQQIPLPTAESPIAKARQAADRAANQIAQNQLADAARSMGDAQRAMEQAAQQAAQPHQPAAEAPGRENTSDNQSDARPGQQTEAKPAGPSPEQLEELAQRQAELQKQAEAMAAQQDADQATAEQAAERLAQISQDLTQIAANDQGALPQVAEQAMNQAAQALTQAASQAGANQPTQAEAFAREAQQALAQAQAAVAMAQSGLTPGAPVAGSAMPGLPGQPVPGAPAQGMEIPGVPGNGGRMSDEGNAFNEAAAQGVHNGHAFIGLPERDREAIRQAQSEPYPEEYAPQIEQYLRNLAAEERN